VSNFAIKATELFVIYFPLVRVLGTIAVIVATTFEQFVLNNSLVAGIVGSVLTVVLLCFREFFSRPRLHLFFDGTDDQYLAESTHPEGDSPAVTRKYLRVSLKATGLCRLKIGGLSGAKNCRIYITSIQPVVNRQEGKDRIYDARQISWPPNKSFEARGIPRGITMFANVVTMRKGILRWTFQIPAAYGLGEDVLTHATLRIGITATADNAKPVSIYIRASVKEDKSGFEARLE
jgi:hypothetical protein